MNKSLITIFIAVLIGAIVYFSIVLGKPFSEIFNNITVGIGALLAGLGGFIAFSDWSKDKIIKNKFEKVKNTYSREKLKNDDANDGFRLLRFPENGDIFIYDLVRKEKFWIDKMSTYYALRFVDKDGLMDWKNITTEEIEKYKNYKRGDDIVAP